MEVNNKYDFLNSIIDMTRKTGQGIPGQLFRMKSSEYDKWLDELLEEGRITSHVQSYSTLPSDEWIMPTGDYYNMWAEDKPHTVLSLVRFYLGTNEERVGDQSWNLRQEPDMMTLYAKFLEKNVDGLKKMVNLPDFDYSDIDLEIKLTDDIITWAKEKRWYEENQLVSECIAASEDWLVSDMKEYKEQLDLVVNMCEKSDAHKKQYKEYKAEQIEFAENVNRRKKFNAWMKQQNQTTNIKELI